MGDREAIAPDYDVHDVHITDERHGQEFNFRVPKRFKDLTFIAQGAYGAVVCVRGAMGAPWAGLCPWSRLRFTKSRSMRALCGARGPTRAQLLEHALRSR